MQNIISLVLTIVFIALPTYAYPESKMEDCILSVINNPAVKEIPDESIKNYCDCILTEKIDNNKDLQKSGYECAVKNFN